MLDSEKTHVPALELRGVRKSFGDCIANEDVHLRIKPGTIHGIIGENGAGKSTAMKIAYGMIRPDRGQILINGLEQRFRSPSDAIAVGIGMVHQHFMLAGPHSALDNILPGAEPARFGWIQRERARKEIVELARKHGLEVDLDSAVEQLALGAQQKIEILKLLYRRANILILDEPTAVLTPQQTTGLFDNLRRLKAEGKTIALITHKLREVMAVTDRVSVLRRGRVVAEIETRETSPQKLAELMIGRNINPAPVSGAARAKEEIALELKEVHLQRAGAARHKLENINLSVHPGEIVGIAGVEGNGQRELVQAIAHPAEKDCRTSGEVTMFGQNVSKWPARKIRELGVGIVPEDRHAEGLLLGAALWENFALGFQRDPPFRRGFFLSRNSIRAAAGKALSEFDVRPPNPDAIAQRLSGGNQQKLIMARELGGKPRLLIICEPTRGVDVGAIEFIHSQIANARDRGAGVLLVSSDLDEIRTLSDRILVMYEGRITAEYQRNAATEAELGLKMGGA